MLITRTIYEKCEVSKWRSTEMDCNIYTHWCNQGLSGPPRGPKSRGGTDLESGYGYMYHDPLFSGQLALPSLPIYHQCTAHVPPIYKTPIFARKSRSLDPTFGNPHGIYPPKKLSAPRGQNEEENVLGL